MSNSPERRPYSTDVSDSEWVLIEPMLSPLVTKKGPGRPRKVNLREVYNAVRYLNRTGCQWEMLPREFPPKSFVYDYFAKWRSDGTYDRIIAALRTGIRENEGREATPSVACIDTPSATTTEVGGDDRGYDGGKKIKGRKRHLLVDVLGLLMAVAVTGANADDGTAAPQLLDRVDAVDLPRLEVIFGDNNSKDYERLADSSEAMIKTSHIGVMLRRLA